MSKNTIKTGIWRHYKGNDYRVLGTIIDATRDEDIVLYEDRERKEGTNKKMTFTRTIEDFLELIYVDGKEEKRFTFLGHESL